MRLKLNEELQSMKQTQLYDYIVSELHPQIEEYKNLVSGMSKNQMSEDLILDIINAILNGKRPLHIIKNLMEKIDL